MPTYNEIPPNASFFGEALRKYGYDFSSALADIIDNSITAKATCIEIQFLPGKDWLFIQDNGLGMSKSDLESAMVLGSGDPLASRDPKDLGRFGCGLKTASFSQARKLTVLSKKNNNICGAQWDLDHIRKSNGWKLGILSAKEVTDYFDKYELSIMSKSGTIVFWEIIDQIKGIGNERAADQNSKIDSAKEHLRLTFHRFIGKNLLIVVNGDELKPLDPFLKGKSVEHPLQKVPIEENSKEYIELQGYTLPALNKLSQTQQDEVRLNDDLNQAQGFYIYRGKRLIKYGGWLGLKKYQALTNLSRVRVDVPNSLDAEWNTDIKKTMMDPPPRVMLQLRKLLNRFSDPSKKIHRRRASDQVKQVEMWQRFEKQEIESDETEISYKINNKAKKFENLLNILNDDQSKKFLELIKDIECELPYQQISIDVIDDKLK